MKSKRRSFILCGLTRRMSTYCVNFSQPSMAAKCLGELFCEKGFSKYSSTFNSEKVQQLICSENVNFAAELKINTPCLVLSYLYFK